MQDFINLIKAGISAIIGCIAIKLGMLAPLLICLVVSMALDYISGIIAAATKGELNSKTGALGIIKKMSYCIAVAVSMITDNLIMTLGADFMGISVESTSIFSTLTIVWLTLNELLSILENLGRMGVPLPKFLGKIIKSLKNEVDNVGEQNAPKK